VWEMAFSPVPRISCSFSLHRDACIRDENDRKRRGSFSDTALRKNLQLNWWPRFGDREKTQKNNEHQEAGWIWAMGVTKQIRADKNRHLS
jgi:hypothetical protein